jgi:hypothetical protein
MSVKEFIVRAYYIESVTNTYLESNWLETGLTANLICNCIAFEFHIPVTSPLIKTLPRVV